MSDGSLNFSTAFCNIRKAQPAAAASGLLRDAGSHEADFSGSGFLSFDSLSLPVEQSPFVTKRRAQVDGISPELSPPLPSLDRLLHVIVSLMMREWGLGSENSHQAQRILQSVK